MTLGIMMHVQDRDEWSRIQLREARTAYIEQTGRRWNPSPVSPLSLWAAMEYHPILATRAPSRSTEIAIASSRRPE